MEQEKAITLPRVIFQEKVIVWSLAVLVPLFFSGPQLLTGSFINALLIYTAMRLPVKQWIPVIIMPSVAAFAHGVIFGPLSWFLFYFLPFIWLGNYLFVFIFNKVNRSQYVKLVISAAVKVALLFAAAYIYFIFGVVPALFLTAMGAVQLITALAGGAAIILFFSARKDGRTS